MQLGTRSMTDVIDWGASIWGWRAPASLEGSADTRCGLDLSGATHQIHRTPSNPGATPDMATSKSRQDIRLPKADQASMSLRFCSVHT